MSYPHKVDIKTCAKQEPPHPCDDPPPCDPVADPEGDCVKPFLCYERIKNPEEAHLTRCKSGASLGVRACVKLPDPHPCDLPKPCIDLPDAKKLVCDEPPLCLERVKNPEVKKIRRVLCVDSKGKIVERETYKKH